MWLHHSTSVGPTVATLVKIEIPKPMRNPVIKVACYFESTFLNMHSRCKFYSCFMLSSSTSFAVLRIEIQNNYKRERKSEFVASSLSSLSITDGPSIDLQIFGNFIDLSMKTHLRCYTFIVNKKTIKNSSSNTNALSLSKESSR